MTKPNWDAKRWSHWKNENEEEDVMVIDRNRKYPMLSHPKYKRKILNSNYPKILKGKYILSLSLEVLNLIVSLKCIYPRR